MQRGKKNDQSSEKNGSTRYRRVFEMFREINVAGFVLKNGWVFCQITFLIYMIILAVMAGLFSVIMLLKTKFHKKSKFPFIPFLMAAYAGGIILNGY